MAARDQLYVRRLKGQTEITDLTRFGLENSSLNKLRVSLATIGIETDQKIANLSRGYQTDKEPSTKIKLMAEDVASKSLLTLTMAPRIISEEVRRKLGV